MLSRDDLLEQAMALPPIDRAFVAAALEDSLAVAEEPPPDSIFGDELLAELRRRSANYRAGLSKARPAAEVMADLFRRQSSEDNS